jgi:hypothetical protein
MEICLILNELENPICLLVYGKDEKEPCWKKKPRKNVTVISKQNKISQEHQIIVCFFAQKL